MNLMEAEAPCGVDPLHPPWELPGPDSDEPPIGMRRSKRLPKHGTPGAPNYREPSSESDDFDSPGPDTSKQRARAPIKGKAPKEADPDHPDTRSGRLHVSSQSFLQQVRNPFRVPNRQRLTSIWKGMGAVSSPRFYNHGTALCKPRDYWRPSSCQPNALCI
jgi:hypothetical protein